MKPILILLFTSNIILSQNKNCNCIVKLTMRDLKLQTALKKNGVSDYELLKKDSNISNFYKITKDSVSYWYVKPIIQDSLLLKEQRVQKISQIFLLPIKFNVTDSIPLYFEPTNKSKILTYIKKENTAPTNYLYYSQDDKWFMGCNKEFVKIKVYGIINYIGWIGKENYYQFKQLNLLKNKN